MYGQGHSFYYVSADETQWKEIAKLVNRVYDSVRHISSQSQGEDKL